MKIRGLTLRTRSVVSPWALRRRWTLWRIGGGIVARLLLRTAMRHRRLQKGLIIPSGFDKFLIQLGEVVLNDG